MSTSARPGKALGGPLRRGCHNDKVIMHGTAAAADSAIQGASPGAHKGSVLERGEFTHKERRNFSSSNVQCGCSPGDFVFRGRRWRPSPRAAGCAADSAPPALQLRGSDPVRIYDPPEPPVSRDVVALHLAGPLVRVEVERMAVVGDLGRAVPPLRRPQQR
jgi:hypothetical protein